MSGRFICVCKYLSYIKNNYEYKSIKINIYLTTKRLTYSDQNINKTNLRLFL